MPSADAIYWFRRDLRLADNPALLAATQRGRVVPVFIWSPEEAGDWPLGGASRWWLHQSLDALNRQLQSAGSRLVIRRGPALETLQKLRAETGARAVCWSRRYEPALVERDKCLKATLVEQGVEAISLNGSLLFEPWEISTKAGGPCQVFTPFWKNCLQRDEPREPLPAPGQLANPDVWPLSVRLAELKLEPRIRWDEGLRAAWTPGELGAQRRVDQFVEAALDDYKEGRNRVDFEGSSRLSPHLHFGEISPQQVWQAIDQATPQAMPTSLAARRASASSRDSFLSEIGWREFSYHLLYHFPQTPSEPLREAFREFPWEGDSAELSRWQRGRTGVPIVDAAMRHLWRTGWMPNRARMIVASYLTKNLLIPWQQGAAWFWDTLVDADLANNTQGWQWTAGCGADAAPYFRIFNPVSQAKKFDPDGVYIRRWIPELRHLDTPWLYSPWETSDEMLAEAGVKLGVDYPEPLVDLGASRKRALEAYEQVKRAT